MRPKAVLRILAVAALALPLIPLQMLAVRRGWPMQRSLPVIFHRTVLRLIGVMVDERRRMETRRPLLIVSNHVSWLDIPVLGSLAGLSFIAKSEVTGWPIIGLFARLQRSVFIDRRRRHDTAEATALIGARLLEGDPIVLFGEGTTGDGTRVLPFRSALIGAAREAMGASDAPVLVQPLAIRYLRRDGLPIARSAMFAIAWTGDMELAPHLMDLLAGGPIDVLVAWGEPIRYAGDTDRKALAKALEATVRRLARDG
jgi:1-acyl-sn-glycerol-3-phosphate acyltransferase